MSSMSKDQQDFKSFYRHYKEQAKISEGSKK